MLQFLHNTLLHSPQVTPLEEISHLALPSTGTTPTTASREDLMWQNGTLARNALLCFANRIIRKMRQGRTRWVAETAIGS